MFYFGLLTLVLCHCAVVDAHVFHLPLRKLTAAQRSPVDVSSGRNSLRADVRVKRQTTSVDDEYNLYGAPGAGYAVEVDIGTPPQRVSKMTLLFKHQFFGL